MTIAQVPSNDAEVFKDYFSLIKWHVAKAKISDGAVEDYAMLLMERFIEHGLLKQYDPSRANFRTFLSGFVKSYLRHFKEQDLKHAERTYLSTDYTVGEDKDTLILDLQGYHAPDQIEEAEAEISLARIRAKLVQENEEKLLLFFDVLMLQMKEHGKLDVSELTELFGVSSQTIYNWKKRLRPYFKELS